MTIIEFIRIVRKHLVLLILVPVLLAALVVLLTSKPQFSYTSQTVLYTGLATGSSIEMDKTFNYFLTNTAFDNLLNIINSRETQQEVAIRLLSQHLLLPKPDPKFISEKSFKELKRLSPVGIYSFVARTGNASGDQTDSSVVAMVRPAAINQVKSPAAYSHQGEDRTGNLFPAVIDRSDYETTVSNLTTLMRSSDTNFVYKLLNFEHPHYSIKAISSIKSQRINNSDLVKLSYEVDDPGICQQTLALFNEVCIKNYKKIKENHSDEVVKYFEAQLQLANEQLKAAEDKLLDFNQANKIINYYEQSKAVAVVKEDMEVDYNNKKAQLAGLEAAIKKLENKLSIQQQVQLKSTIVLDKKRELGAINYEIAMAGVEAAPDSVSQRKMAVLAKKAAELKGAIRESIDELYTYQNTVDGLPVSTVLSEWITHVTEAESLKAKLLVMDQRNREFRQQYAIYAPAGAHIKRIEREISVSEQGYLELLHGLNLAKLKLQDNELSAELKAIDPPYYPITAVPTKRKLLVVAAALLGCLLVMACILFMEYFDDSLKNLKKASGVLQLPALGMLPRACLNTQSVCLDFIQQRLLDVICQNVKQALHGAGIGGSSKMIVVLSSQPTEGKTVLAANLARTLVTQGKKVCVLNFSRPYHAPVPNKRSSLLSRFFGYPDASIDPGNALLQPPDSYLTPDVYQNGLVWQEPKSWTGLQELMYSDNKANLDYVFVELPAILANSYPAELIAAADMTLLVCRSNRVWSSADQTALDGVAQLAEGRIRFVLNGVELLETESLLGELPKSRSRLRKQLKNMVRFQFFSKNQF